GALEDRYINRDLIHRSYLEQLPLGGNFTYHEISASAGGPVYIPKIYNGKDKTFWFFGFQRHHEKEASSWVGAVPSNEMLAGDFSFGGAGFPIYDPDTTRFGPNANCPAGQAECWSRDPFPGNRVPVSRFDPAVRNFLDRKPWASPNQPGFVNAQGPNENLLGSAQYRSYRTRFDAKVDHQFSANHKIFGRYSHVRHRSFAGDITPQIAWLDINPVA